MKEIPGFKNCFISKEGIIYQGSILKKTRLDRYGYERVNVNGKNRRVHRLLAITYFLNPENKTEINHKNGIRHDNRLENLEWCTPSENRIHSYKNGLQIKGNHKLTKLDLIKLKSLIEEKSGFLAKKFNVCRQTIRNYKRKWEVK